MVLVASLTVVLTAGLIRASVAYDVELVSSPNGPVVHAPRRQPFNISCQVSGGDASNVSDIKWMGPKGNDISGHGNPGIVKCGNSLLYLTFTDPTSTHGGMYKCVARYANDYNLQYAVDIVFDDPAPAFLQDYEIHEYTEGDRVELHCFALGETPITYEWLNEWNAVLPTSGSMSIVKSSNESYLVIDNVQPSDEGMYSCSAENKPTAGSRKYFNVRVIPKSGLYLLEVKLVNVTATSVQFDITGPGRYIEMRYVEDREDNEERRFLEKRPDKIYSIKDLVPGGKYTFQFRVGKVGNNSNKWSRELAVTLLPDAVAEIIVRRQEKGTLEFEWVRRVDDIVRGTIDKYEISYYSLSMQSGFRGWIPNRWIPSHCAVTIQTPACRGQSYIIAGLSPNSYYQIEVRAHTEAGYGEPSKLKIYMQN